MKMYQLLRDNVSSGPYTVECLKQMNLQALDLIWVENESIVWKYPSELKELSGFAPKAEKTIGTRVNTLKERQIRYFREYLGASREFSMSTYTTDAFTSNIPEGFEFLVAADDYNRYGGNLFVSSKPAKTVKEEITAETPLTQEHNTYHVLGQKQFIDTLEMAADHQQFTSVLPVTRKSKVINAAKEMVNNAPAKKNYLSVVTGIGLIASLLGFLKL